MIKDQEFLKDIASFCIENSKKLGATDVGVKVIHSVSENVSFRNKKLDESNRADSFAVNLTTYIEKKKSSINSSDLSKSNLEKLIGRCIDATKITPSDENNSLYSFSNISDIEDNTTCVSIKKELPVSK